MPLAPDHTAGPSTATGVHEPERQPADWQGDPLSGFPAEAEVTAAVVRARRMRTIYFPAAAGLLGLVALAVFLAPGPWRASGTTVSPGTLIVESSPPGVQVFEAGRALGRTPLTISLPAGPHALVLRRDAAERPLAVDVRPASLVVHHVELGEAPRTGSLRVESIPPGATVEVDGSSRGRAPLDVSGLEPGEHDVTVRTGGSLVSQKVSIAAGGAASLVVPLTQLEASTGARVEGWVTVESPIELQVYEGDALVGSSEMSRVRLPAGRRTLRLVNDQTGFATTARVQIRAGAETRLPVTLPSGQISVNAVPWAEVFIDGRRVGETPIANHTLQIGAYEVILRNPRYPEQRRAVVVSEALPVRLGVDLRQ